tara:strand:- start:6878 stop:7312 length:435 start_codon:yes stop_codon:yes gene_type:complete
MSATEGFKIGKAVFNILKNNDALMQISGMSAGLIQPAPLKEQGATTLGITYEFDAVNPLNIKRVFRLETAPLYIVDFTLECIAKDYSTSILLADYATTALQESSNGSYGDVKVNGITLESANEDYNKARKYYSKRLSFQARILL